ncbi:MAG: ComF family protein [Parcubacteria group bacterium]|nr:ComF family protein [Parcubacteria group bacterium]
MHLQQFFRDFWRTVLDVVFPASDRARRVAAGSTTPLPCAPHVKTLCGRDITILASYENVRVRDAICALKFERDKQSLDLLSCMLNEFLVEQQADEALFGGRIVAIPIPLGKKRHSERGMNQVEAILKNTALARSGSINIVPALVRTRETLQQSTLPRDKRMENVHGAFGAVHHLLPTLHNATAEIFKERSDYENPSVVAKQATVLLIDDVATTGATLSEAATALENENIRVELLALAG